MGLGGVGDRNDAPDPPPPTGFHRITLQSSPSPKEETLDISDGLFDAETIPGLEFLDDYSSDMDSSTDDLADTDDKLGLGCLRFESLFDHLEDATVEDTDDSDMSDIPPSQHIHNDPVRNAAECLKTHSWGNLSLPPASAADTRAERRHFPEHQALMSSFFMASAGISSYLAVMAAWLVNGPLAIPPHCAFV